MTAKEFLRKGNFPIIYYSDNNKTLFKLIRGHENPEIINNFPTPQNFDLDLHKDRTNYKKPTITKPVDVADFQKHLDKFHPYKIIIDFTFLFLVKIANKANLELIIDDLQKRSPNNWSDFLTSITPLYTKEIYTLWSTLFALDSVQSIIVTTMRSHLVREIGAEFQKLISQKFYPSAIYELNTGLGTDKGGDISILNLRREGNTTKIFSLEDYDLSGILSDLIPDDWGNEFLVNNQHHIFATKYEPGIFWTALAYDKEILKTIQNFRNIGKLVPLCDLFEFTVGTTESENLSQNEDGAWGLIMPTEWVEDWQVTIHSGYNPVVIHDNTLYLKIRNPDISPTYIQDFLKF